VTARRGSCVFPRPVVWVTTAGTPRDRWLEARLGGIGGSDVAAVCGLSQFKTAWALWAERTGLVDPDESAWRERAEWGNVLEDAVAKRWAAAEGATIRRAGMVADPVHPWRLASLDRAILVPGTRRAEALLECKTTSERSGDMDDAAILDRYRLQVQWYLGITGLAVAHLAVLVGGQELRRWEVPADPDLYGHLCDRVDGFWRDSIVGGAAPALVPQDAAELDRLDPDPGAPPAHVDADLAELIAQRAATVAEAEFWADAKRLLDAAVKAHMGRATTLLDADGREAATWREQTARRVDTTRLRQEQPGIAEEYTTASTTRVLRYKALKGDA
jgi:putative phage-type endonuclease